ncbi:MAG: NADH-quinone oxidoreductase subunit [Gaiellales bacterium]|jgi:NADH:ubiquinone oxidoreductase subunit 6 (subunit J)|nr:NADH-quinone oxidoreductase subunit [Gaiellales bacterium]MDX6598361.1 NADH-quinone oxidoreductase subunit [Gaiellales bacterium]
MGIAVFYLAGAAAIGSAIAVVVQRNPFLAALSLILHLASLAALYLVLQGDFVAVAQLLVYAGAVMIMFLFVIAYLGDRADLDLRRGGIGAGAAGLAGLAIFVETVIAVSDSGDVLTSTATVADSFGSPQTIGRIFLTDHLLAFEAISLILLVGAIAGVVLGAGDLLPSGRRDEPGEREPRGERFDLRRELQRREHDDQERESEVGA